MKPMSDPRNSGKGLGAGQVALGVFGLVAPVVTFLLAISSLSDTAKIVVLLVLAFGYSCVCLWSFQKSHTDEEPAATANAGSAGKELEQALQAIGEASEFFGSSLKPSDLFRLVLSRVAHVFPFSASALFVQSESAASLEIAQSDGFGSDAKLEAALPMEKGLAGMAWLSREVETDAGLELERAAMPPGSLNGLHSAVAIPLLHENQPFAVLVLYKDQPLVIDPELDSMLEAIGERVAPLFLSSLSFERSVSNALTDSLTSLPNERAFFMVLENQLAESQRFRGERPLTVVSVDIKNFAEMNQNFGFAAGDRMLAFVSQNLAGLLRKMDFLSRSVNDEFLIILPTASEKFAGEILQRIKDHFTATVFAVSETEDVKVWLNFGLATFWQDGETAEQLLQHARLRKQQSKAEEPSKVLWFPKEYVN
ncbi:MAG TPA: sensor domain-containing diguanylate cyclase [Pyrinomonadaceae bacterium]|nr:sensor domain-containing diguanylate cyclase [Pyrinomonadaceae bacterium]